MPSASLQRWRKERRQALKQILDAHKGIGGVGRGRRFATQQVNYAYAVLLSSQFQGFCRDLHSESVDYLVQVISPNTFKVACYNIFMRGRKLDSGNPNPGNIGSDYNPLGLIFWNEVKALDSRNSKRQNRLEELNEWRNAIAHQDSKFLNQSTLGLRRVQIWRRACDHLVVAFDEVMRRHIQAIIGDSPW